MKLVYIGHPDRAKKDKARLAIEKINHKANRELFTSFRGIDRTDKVQIDFDNRLLIWHGKIVERYDRLWIDDLLAYSQFDFIYGAYLADNYQSLQIKFRIYYWRNHRLGLYLLPWQYSTAWTKPISI